MGSWARSELGNRGEKQQQNKITVERRGGRGGQSGQSGERGPSLKVPRTSSDRSSCGHPCMGPQFPEATLL